jgi:ABC-type Zn uptake system ZnuABC Zn-binding protein ZnuA
MVPSLQVEVARLILTDLISSYLKYLPLYSYVTTKSAFSYLAKVCQLMAIMLPNLKNKDIL